MPGLWLPRGHQRHSFWPTAPTMVALSATFTIGSRARRKGNEGAEAHESSGSDGTHDPWIVGRTDGKEEAMIELHYILLRRCSCCGAQYWIPVVGASELCEPCMEFCAMEEAA